MYACSENALPSCIMQPPARVTLPCAPALHPSTKSTHKQAPLLLLPPSGPPLASLSASAWASLRLPSAASTPQAARDTTSNLAAWRRAMSVRLLCLYPLLPGYNRGVGWGWGWGWGWRWGWRWGNGCAWVFKLCTCPHTHVHHIFAVWAALGRGCHVILADTDDVAGLARGQEGVEGGARAEVGHAYLRENLDGKKGRKKRLTHCRENTHSWVRLSVSGGEVDACRQPCTASTILLAQAAPAHTCLTSHASSFPRAFTAD